LTAQRVLTVVLGLVFLASGSSKIVSPQWPDQARALNAPGVVAVVLPWLELTLGAVAVAGVRPQVVLVAMVVLLVAFTGALTRVLLAGRRPVCACFGRWSARPIGWWSVARNLLLLAAALVALS
jgi:hypothetical protein